MANGKRLDPYRGFRFRVEVAGFVSAAFSEATIPDSSTDITEYREGTDPTTQRKLSGLTKFGNITLKRGITDSLEFFNWRKQVEDTGAHGARRDISLILVDEAGDDKARWDIKEAWPIKFDTTDFSAKANEVLIESLEICHENVVRVS